MKLPRPYIPTPIRLAVAWRQCRAIGFEPDANWFANSDTWKLQFCLGYLFGYGKSSLDHDPAICNRKFNPRTGKYTPDANDPRYLVYRTKEEHDIKTRVRGDGAQLSDLAMLRKNKRIAKRILTGKRPRYGVSK